MGNTGTCNKNFLEIIFQVIVIVTWQENNLLNILCVCNVFVDDLRISQAVAPYPP